MVVVGGADDKLRVSRAKRKLEGVTQSMVERCVLDELGEFVGRVIGVAHGSGGDASETENGRVVKVRSRRRRDVTTSDFVRARGDVDSGRGRVTSTLPQYASMMADGSGVGMQPLSYQSKGVNSTL